MGPYARILKEQEEQTAPAGIRSPYALILEEQMAAQERERLRVLNSALAVNPDQVAETRRLASDLAVPPVVVDTLGKEESLRRLTMREMANSLPEVPTLARKYTDEDFARIASDDYRELSTLEKILRGGGGRGIQRALLQDKTGKIGFKLATGQALSVTEIVELSEAQEKLAELARDQAGRGALSFGLNEIAYAGTQLITGLPFAAAGAGAGAGVGAVTGAVGAAVAGQAGPQVVAPEEVITVPVAAAGSALVWGGRGYVLGQGVYNYTTATGLAYLEYSNFRDVNNELLPKDIAIGAAHVTGVLTVGLETLSDVTLAKVAVPGLDRLLSQPAKKTVAELLATTEGRTLLSRLGSRVGQASGVEAVTEVLQETANILAGEGAKLVAEQRTGVEFEAITTEAATERVVMAGVSGAIGGGGLAVATAPVTIPVEQYFERRELARRQAESRTAAGQINQLERAVEAAGASKLAQRDRETLETFINDAAADAGGEASTVFLSVESLAQVAQDRQTTVQQLADLLGVSEQLRNAAATSTDIQVPVGKFVSTVAGTDLAAPMIEIAKLNPFLPSRADMAQLTEAGQQEVIARAEYLARQAMQDEATRAGAEAVRSDVLGKLNAVGRFSGNVNKVYASATASFYVSLAQRLGITPQEALQRNPLNIAGERITGAPAGQVQRTVNLFRGVGESRDPAAATDVGRFLSPDRAVAEGYAGQGGTVAEEQVTFNNLLETQTWMQAKQQLGLTPAATMQDLVAAAQAQGYDGVSFTTKNGVEYIQVPAAPAGETLASTFRPVPVTEAEQQQMEAAADQFEDEAFTLINDSEFSEDMLDEQLELIRERYEVQIEALRERDTVQAAQDVKDAYLDAQQPMLDAMDPDSDAYFEELDRVEQEGERIYREKYDELESDLYDEETDIEAARDAEIERETGRLEAEARQQIEDFRRQAVTDLVDRFEEAYGTAALLNTTYEFYAEYDTRERFVFAEDGTSTSLRDLIARQGETFGQEVLTPAERLKNRGPLRKARGNTYMGVAEKYTVENTSPDAPLPVRNGGLILSSTSAGNADAQSEALDALQKKHKKPLSSLKAWIAYTNDAFSLTRVPMPPWRTLKILKGGPDMIADEIRRLSPGMVRDAEEGLATAAKFGQLYASGDVPVSVTAKAFLWSFLSKGVNPYVQEGGFLDAVTSAEATRIIETAARDGWSPKLEADWAAWAESAIPPGSPGRATQHNLNGYGREFLNVMTRRHDDAGGKTGLQIIHDMIVDGTPSYLIRREFLKRGVGAGIDNKVVSFTLLLLGRTDVIVLDRVQIRNQFDDGRFADQNIYDDDKDANGKPIAGTAFAEITYNHKGLVYYEAMERALKPLIEQAYAALGREGSLGRYHWDSWLLASDQEVGHASVEGLLREAGGEANPYAGTFVRQGKYMQYDYGFRYGVTNDGRRVTLVQGLADGNTYIVPNNVVSDDKGPLRKALSKLATKARKRAKDAENVTPWTHFLTEEEKAEYDQAIASGGTVAPDVWADDPDAVGRTDLAAGAEPETETIGPEETFGQEGLRERPQQPRVIYEVAPDPNDTALANRWRQLTPEQRLAISKTVAEEILPGVLRDLGASGRVLDQIGSYLNDTNPSFALALAAGDVDTVTKIFGFVLSQDSMMAISPKEFPGSFQTSALRVDIGDKTFDEVAAIYNTLRAITLPDGRQPIGGQTTSDGEMTILLGAEDDARAIAQLVDAALGNAYTVEIAKVFAAFPEKQEYDYASERDDPPGSAGLARQRARVARSEASRVLAREIDRILGSAEAQGAARPAGRGEPSDRGRLSSPRRLPDGTTEAVHYGRVAGLTITDPTQWGKGGAFLSRAERNRIGEAPPRTYFGLNVGIPGGYVKEAGTGDNVYYAYIPLDRLYDLSGDPDNLVERAKEILQARKVAPFSAFEIAIQEAGYAGLWVNNPAYGMSGIVFEPVPVSTERRPDAVPPDEETFGQDPIEAFETPGSPEWEAAVRKFGVEGMVWELPDGSDGPRKARARAMGYDVDNILYHGTDADITSFRASRYGTFGEGVYLDPDPAGASHYAQTQDGGNVLPVYVKGKIATEADVPIELTRGDEIADWVYDNGYAGYTHTYTGGGTETVVFNPRNIRSVNAAFDPENEGSADILAQPENYFGRQSMRLPGVGPSEREIELAQSWRPVLPAIQAARTAATAGEQAADIAVQSRAPDDIAKAKNAKAALRSEIDAAQVARMGMDTPEDARLADALAALREDTNDPILLSTQIGAAKTSLERLLTDLGRPTMPSTMMRAPQRPPLRRTFSAEEEARLAAEQPEQPSRTRYAEGEGPPTTRYTAPGRRGEYSPRLREIRLNATADFSTFLHELGHHFLEVYDSAALNLRSREAAGETLTDSEREVIADTRALLTELGRQTGQTVEGDALDWWRGKTFEQRREMHEQFARLTEAYFMDGQAPVPGLQRMFQTFKRWLLRVYSSIRDLDVELNDEVRGILDRMVSAEANIKTAEQDRGLNPAFTEKPAFMDDATWRAYQDLARQATLTAEETLTARSLRDMQWLRKARAAEIRRLQKEVAGLRASVETEVRGQIGARPVNRARMFLRRGIRPDGTEVQGPHKLSIDLLKTQFPPDRGIDWQSLGYGKYGMLGKEGLDPDTVAEMLGYPSGEAMIQDLLTAEPMEETVQAETDARMLEQYGDLSSEAALNKAADEAIHNVFRARVLAAEYSALSSAVGGRRMLAEQAQQIAQQQIGKLRASKLDPARFIAAERRAQRKAEKAIAANDLASAAAAKRDQLLNFELARETQRVLKERNRALDLFKRIVSAKKDTVSKSRNYDLVQAARAILSVYGLGRVSNAPLEYLAAIKQYDPNLYAALEPTLISALSGGKQMDAMSVDEFLGLRDTIQQLWDLSREEKKVEIEGKQQELADISEQLVRQLETVGDIDRQRIREAATEWQKSLRQFAGMAASLRRVESWARLIDGGVVGPFTRFIWRPISEAADRYRTDRNTYIERFRALFSAIEDGMTGRKIAAAELNYTFANKAELLHAILHTGNASNKRKLLLGRQWGQERTDGTLDDRQWQTFVERMAREGVLTKADMDFVQGVWDLLDQIKPLAQETHRKVFGRYFSEITAEPVQTPFGMYRGGYVPAIYDQFFVADAVQRAQQDAIEANDSQMFPSVASGFTKSRVDYNEVLLLDLRLLPQHIDKVLKFAHMAGPVRDVLRVLKNKDFSRALEAIDPTAQSDMLLPWLQRSARQITETPTSGQGGRMVDAFFRAMRQRSGMGLMFANLVNVAQQVTGFSLAALQVNPKYLASSLIRYTANPKRLTDAVNAASPMMRDRMSNQMSVLFGEIDKVIDKDDKYGQAVQWFGRHTYFMQQAVQNVMDVIVWTGAYDQALARGETETEAAKQGDAAVRQTQGTTFAEDVSRIETGPAVLRTFTHMYTYFNMWGNLLSTEMRLAVREAGLRKGAGRLLYIYFAGFAAPAMLAQLIADALRGQLPEDEDDDGWLDEWLGWFFGTQSKTALAFVPIAGQAGVATMGAFTSVPYDDRVGGSPAISTIEAAVRTPASVYKAVAEEGDKSRAVKDTLTLMTLLTGLPFQVAARPAAYAVDVAEGDIEPTDDLDYLRGLVTGSASEASR